MDINGLERRFKQQTTQGGPPSEMFVGHWFNIYIYIIYVHIIFIHIHRRI